VQTQLSLWLKAQIKRRGINAYRVSREADVGGATISDIMRMGHIPRIDTLFRLADYFGEPREDVLRAAAGLPVPAPQDDYLIDELLAAFRHIPGEWKQDALAQVESWARHATRPPIRIIGSDEEK